MKKFLSELKRRQVVKPLLAYVGLAWLILQIVSVLGSMMFVNSLVGPATFLLLACGLPVAGYLFWHFDFSYNGITRTPSLDEQDNLRVKPFGLMNWSALTLLVLGSSFVGIQYFDLVKQDLQQTQLSSNKIKLADSIAVLPFEDVSPEQNQSYLASGLAEEITSLLGRSNEFKVSASRSSQILAKQGLSPSDIGRRLEVATLLTGSVSVVGERLQISVSLVNTENGHVLWSEKFLRKLTDIFAIESEIGRAIVNLLQDKYLQAGSFDVLSNTSSTDAYVMYLKGREEYRKQTTESMQQARQFFEQAVALDPEFAKAYVGLADCLILLADSEYGFGVIKTDIAAGLAKQNIDKAFARQPQMAEAYAVKGYISFMLSEFESAIIDYDKAIELNPNFAKVYMWKNLALEAIQRFDEAFLALKKSLELDPLFLTGTYNLGIELTFLGRYDEAKHVFQQLKIDFPDSTFSHQGLADLYFSQGDFVGAIREGQNALMLSPNNQELVQKLVGPLLQLGLTDIVRRKAADPLWQSGIEHYFESILIFEKNFESLFDRMDFKLAANPDDYWLEFEAGWYHSMFGVKKRALALLTNNQAWLEDVDKYAMPYCSPAIEIAWALQELGDETKALSIIEKCKVLMDQQLQSFISYSEVYYLASRIYALQGQPIKSIQALQTAIDKGWREWWTQYDPLLKSLEKEFKFQALLQVINDDLARQRVKAAALFNESKLLQ